MVWRVADPVRFLQSRKNKAGASTTTAQEGVRFLRREGLRFPSGERLEVAVEEVGRTVRTAHLFFTALAVAGF